MPGVSHTECEAYLSELTPRLVVTMRMVPPATPGARLLELGASPYYMTLWLQRNTTYELSLANFHNTGLPEGAVHLSSARYGESYTFRYQNFNVETDRFPYLDRGFDVVLCCEILEHLTCDPTHMLVEIHRVLKPEGYLLLTTPNVLVWRHITLMLKHGKNIYHPYSGYGVYGRHNREYTLDEVVQLLRGCGYEIVEARAEDTYPHRGYSAVLKRFFPRFRDNLFVLVRAVGSPTHYYPENLYRAIHASRHVTDVDFDVDSADTNHPPFGFGALSCRRLMEREAHV